MATEEENADWRKIKRTRGAQAGSLTKLVNKLRPLHSGDISKYDIRTLERAQATIKKAEAAFQQTVEEVTDMLDVETDDAKIETNDATEDAAKEAFAERVAEAWDLVDEMLILRQTHLGLEDLHIDADAFQDNLTARPELHHGKALEELKAAFAKIRKAIKKSKSNADHPIRQEINRFSILLTRLSSETKSSTAEATPSTHPISIRSKDSEETCQIPKLTIPEFHGDIMEWSSFWVQFEASIDSHERLSDVRKLAYLRRAIKDPDTKDLLQSGAETGGLYKEVVAVLKKRFDRTREIHRNHCQKLIQFGNVKGTRTDLRKFVDAANTTIASIKHSGHYNIDAFLTSIFYANVPVKIQTLWEQNARKIKGIPAVNEFLEFVSEHAEALPGSSTASVKTPDSKPEKKYDRKYEKKQEAAPYKHHKAAVHSATPSSGFRWECSLCKPEKHPLYACSKWESLNIQQRLGHLTSNQMCHNCLTPGHKASDCSSQSKCKVCNSKHNTMVHKDAPATLAVSTNTSSPQSLCVPDVLMLTAQVTLTGPGNKKIQARALIDSGSSMTLVSNRISQALNLPITKARVTFSGVQDTPAQASNSLVTVILSPIQVQRPQLPITAAVVPKVTCNLPLQGAPKIQDLPHFQELTLADPTYHQPGRIDLLLGSDVVSQVLLPDYRPGLINSPCAWNTIFGWALVGPFKATDASTSAVVSNVNHGHTDEQGNHLLARFWEIEDVHELTEADTPEEEQVQLHYNQTVKYIPSQCRYQVTLPKKAGLPPLGESRHQALQRYHSNEKSIIRRNTWTLFQGVVQEYLDLGHAELVPSHSSPPANNIYYLPMHSVVKESSTSTKLRVVFDASAHTSSGMSLNQSLLVGPTLHPTLETILLRFRTYPIAVSADISKMYREVELAEEDRDLHRFLWRPATEDPIQDFRMKRVTFGVSASPYLAVRTLQQTAQDHGNDHPIASLHVHQSFYVDDFLAGADTVDQALELYGSLRAILAKGGFNICKWRSSSPSVLNAIEPSLREKLPVKEVTDSYDSPHPKALGLEWNSNDDTMSTSLNLPEAFLSTKRGVISDVAKTFDVLGWIAPTIILMKIMYQRLWELKLEWDEEIPQHFIAQHSEWREQLPLLSSKRQARCYFRVGVPCQTIELHGFSDASERAYAAVVYIRSTYSEHSPIVSLVASKTKVAPIRPLTIPRLELCGAALLSKLLTTVSEALKIPTLDIHAWCDSTIVLTWLNGNPKHYKTYVGNRIATILKATPPEVWNHVPTADNPADCASRGMLPRELVNHTLWWEGPSWLKTEPILTPTQPHLRSFSTPELRVVACNLSVPVPPEWIEANYSSYHKLVAVTAWCQRFVAHIKLHVRKQPIIASAQLTIHDLNRAEQFLVMRSQAWSFPKELYQLHHDRLISNSSKILSLTPSLGKDGLLRIGGRLSNANLSLSQAHPLILCSKDILPRMYFTHMHACLGHCGPSLLLCSTGSKFHVLGARCLSRAVCRQCVTCRRVTAKTQRQLMGQLPAARHAESTLLHDWSGLCRTIYLEKGPYKEASIM